MEEEQQLVDQAAESLAGVTVQHTGEHPPVDVPVALTLPHASPKYSGRTAALALVSEIRPDEPVLLLGFRHDGMPRDCRTDHSVGHVQALLTAHGCKHVTVHCAQHGETLHDWPAEARQVVISTDFSHFNISNAPTVDVTTICRQDTHESVKILNADQSWKEHPPYHQPCGRSALVVVQPWTTQWHVLYYHNSNPHTSTGVGYAVLRGFRHSPLTPLLQWKANLDSRVLAWAHLQHVQQALAEGQTTLPELCWSPLMTQQGSCFLTVYGADGKVRSCFGAWQGEAASLWDALTAAFHRVRTNSWGSISPETARAEQAQLAISLISPQAHWTTTDQCRPGRGCRVQNSATYLASVWQQIREARSFTAGLRQKAGGSTAPLQVYDEVVWQTTTPDHSAFPGRPRA